MTKSVHKEQCVQEMRLQFAETGRIDMTGIIKKFPDVEPSTLWSWSRKVRNGEPLISELHSAHDAMDGRIKAGAQGVEQVIPYVAPAIIAMGGERALQQIDYASEMALLWSDVHKLREFAMSILRDPQGAATGEFKIKSPQIFERSIRTRMDLVESGLKIMGELWDMRRLQMYFRLIVDEVGKEAPDVQVRILNRLEELNKRHGMTMAMYL